MIHVYPNTKVYVHCPAGVVTGGAELLHQLVDTLNRNHINAYIVYFGTSDHSVPDDYRNYNINVSEYVEDHPDNIEVIYEGRFDLVRVNKKIQKFLWWLSVDNFYICSTPFLSVLDIASFNKKLAVKALLRQIKRLLMNKDRTLLHPLTLAELRKMNILHGYQSEYAQNFLQKLKFRETIALKDFINTDHQYDSTLKKKNVVLYNPKKGFEFTKKIIASAPHISWIPLVGMSREQLIKTIKSAKVYIDFGYHPGKDRLPRECAMNGCCIITGYSGSAGFFEDVAIPNGYKFNKTGHEIKRIISKIEYIFENYDSAIKDFHMYRKIIGREKAEFEDQVALIFGYQRI